MNSTRREFVSQLARRLNNTVDYEKQTNAWLCLLFSPLLALVILGFVPTSYVSVLFVIFMAVYLCIYIRLTAKNFTFTSECIDKVFRFQPEMLAVLRVASQEEWADVDTETDPPKEPEVRGSCKCDGCSH